MAHEQQHEQGPPAALKRLVQDLMSKRLVVEKSNGKKLFEAPLVAGLGVMVALGPWTAVGVAAALLTDHAILVRSRQAGATHDEPDKAPYIAEEAAVEPESTLCQATTKAGTPCKLPAHPGSAYCHVHQPAG